MLGAPLGTAAIGQYQVVVSAGSLMAYPTSLDSFTTKTNQSGITDTGATNIPFAEHINALQTAIVALETKVGVNNSAVGTSLDYLVKGSWSPTTYTADATVSLASTSALVDASTSSVALTLPLAAGSQQTLTVTRTDGSANVARVVPTSPDTVQGDTEIRLVGAGASVTLGRAVTGGWTVVGTAATPEQPGIVPSDLPDLDLWLKASTLTVVADGTAVQTFTDQSGLGQSPTQATLANRPLYKTGILAGPAVRFDGSNDLMARTGVSHLPTWTVFGCFIVRGGTGAIRWLFTKATDSSAINIGVRVHSSNQLRVEFTTGSFTYKAVSSTTTITTGTPYVYVGTWDGTTLNLYLQGVLEASLTPGTTPDQTGTVYELGGCNGEGTTGVFNGDIVEQGVYHRGVSAATAFSLARYLSRTYGVALV